MKTCIKKIALLSSLFFASVLCITTTVVTAQAVYHSNGFDIKLNGTSNIHDWQMKAANGSSEVSFLVDANGKVTNVSRLSFTLPVKNLKSKHTAMDKNTYKALKTDKNPNISFVSSSAAVTATGVNNYQITCQGRLSIAGTTKQTELIATGKYNPADKSFTVTGVKKMKMTDYNVQPPKALMGTITTGNDISISYNLKFNK